MTTEQINDSKSSILFQFENTDPKEVLKICTGGDIFWRGKEVTGDDEFKAAMVDLKDQMSAVIELERTQRQLRESQYKYSELVSTVLQDTGFENIEEYLNDLSRK